MKCSQFIVYIILNINIKCDEIAEDYDNTDINNSSQNGIELLGINSKLKIFTNDVSTENTRSIDNEEDENDEFDELNIYMPGKLNNDWSTIKLTTDADNTPINESILRLYSSSPTRRQSSIRPIDFFKDPEYEYNEEDVTLSYRGHHHLLRGNTLVDSSKKVPPMFTINNSTIATVGKDVIGPPIDFLNLEPAADFIGMEIQKVSRPRLNEDTWYVKERSPCWALPILYGESVWKDIPSDVFSLYAGLLKNVKDIGKPVNLNPQTVDLHSSAPNNKWCSSEPCYGDHTLCLFSHSRLSNLCDLGYHVLTPTMSEQIGLVNTVNSMRNRVASGRTIEYPNLPPAANMQQIIYDYDLESIAEAWLRQCLPGPAPCSAINGHYVTSLECTKYADRCCIKALGDSGKSTCVLRSECSVSPIIGCVHIWFTSGTEHLDKMDVNCGHTKSTTYPTTQLIWADTNKVGCAYGIRDNADVRVVCNFAPGAPFILDIIYYCGFIHYEFTYDAPNKDDIMDLENLSRWGLKMKEQSHIKFNYNSSYESEATAHHKINESHFQDINQIRTIYDQEEIRKLLIDHTNRSSGMVARLVTKYIFIEDTESRCDTNKPMYIIGEPGSQCTERGRKYRALCYDFRDPTPGYRLIAVVAAILLFSVIIYDLLSGVVRQANG